MPDERLYFNIPTESWEQAAQGRIKWRCLINKGAAQFELKRICEAERKRIERKARVNDSSSDSAQSEFTCSIWHRQFRAKIGLHSHQAIKEHTITLEHLTSGLKMVFVSTERRTITEVIQHSANVKCFNACLQCNFSLCCLIGVLTICLL